MDGVRVFHSRTLRWILLCDCNMPSATNQRVPSPSRMRNVRVQYLHHPQNYQLIAQAIRRFDAFCCAFSPNLATRNRPTTYISWPYRAYRAVVTRPRLLYEPCCCQGHCRTTGLFSVVGAVSIKTSSGNLWRLLVLDVLTSWALFTTARQQCHSKYPHWRSVYAIGCVYKSSASDGVSADVSGIPARPSATRQHSWIEMFRASVRCGAVMPPCSSLCRSLSSSPDLAFCCGRYHASEASFGPSHASPCPWICGCSSTLWDLILWSLECDAVDKTVVSFRPVLVHKLKPSQYLCTLKRCFRRLAPTVII